MDHNNDYTPPFGNNDEITPPNENPSDITEATASELPSANSTFSAGTAQTGVDPCFKLGFNICKHIIQCTK